MELDSGVNPMGLGTGPGPNPPPQAPTAGLGVLADELLLVLPVGRAEEMSVMYDILPLVLLVVTADPEKVDSRHLLLVVGLSAFSTSFERRAERLAPCRCEDPICK